MAAISFPIRVNPGTGTLVLSAGRTRIEEQIQEILNTRFLERVLRPEFGTEEYLFTSINNPELIATKIQFSLKTYLSANIVTRTEARLDNSGKVTVTITYTDTSNNQQGNLTSSFNT